MHLTVACAVCKAPIKTTPYRLAEGRGKFCSRSCARKMTDSKFLAKIDKKGPIHPRLKSRCWLWIGHVASDGYGVVRYARKAIGAHRRHWELVNGEIPKGLRVLHKCDNRRCVNPEHLFIGTDLDNIRDRDSKGRQVRGERSHLSKLTDEKVLEIRRIYAVRGKSAMSGLAKRFGVTVSQIRWIVNRWCWKHV